VPSPRLVATVGELDLATYQGPGYRHVAARWNPLSGAGARTVGGRWNPPDSFATLYVAVRTGDGGRRVPPDGGACRPRT
jgi:hypothetical protein